MEILVQIATELEAGEDARVAALTGEALAAGLEPKRILDEGLLAGMTVVGRRFREHEIFLPDVLLAAKAMYAGLDLLRSLLLKEGVSQRGKVILGTVRGDIHDIGKNLVAIMLRGAGYEVIDLGNDVGPKQFAAAVRESGARILGMSTLLTTTMPVMAEVLEHLESEGLRGDLKVIVGGAPLGADFAATIGADAYGYDAANAVERVDALIAQIESGN